MPALNETPEDGKPNGERIAKVIARSGLCSRRDAEVLIGEKRVSVNGAVIESAALDVSPSDKVLVDGKPLAAPEPPRLWRFHKPKGRVTTHKDPEGRPTVFDALPENLPRLISVGRLDFNTEGLLLLTNDGDLARHLELPSTGWTRRYRVRAFGRIEQSKLDELAAGLRTGGVNYGPIEATLEREQGDNVWITLSIREGKNREVRRIMEHLGLSVNRLIRVSFGPFMLGDIEPGQIEEVKTGVLKDQLGPRLARQFGVKREPVREERRLPPARSKPTYLRRKPDAVEKPERLREERPMRRRRILAEGGEAAKVELVPDKKWRPARFERGSEGGPEQGALRRRAERPEDRKRPGETRPARHRAETGDNRRGQNAGERPRWKSSADRGGEGRGEQREERPRWKTSPERGTGRARSHFRREGDEQRPKAASEPRGEGSHRDERRPYRQRRAEEGRSNGDRPKPFEKRFQRREDGRDENRGARRGRETEMHAAKGEAESRRTQRPEGRSQRPQRRAEGASDGGKPRFFEKRGGSDGSKRSVRTRGEGGKSFKPRAGSAQRPRPGAPRKPRPKAGEETP